MAASARASMSRPVLGLQAAPARFATRPELHVRPRQQPRHPQALLTLTETQKLVELTGDTFYQFLQQHQHSGHLTVVDFFTEWCGPCKLAMPVLRRWSKEFDSNAVTFTKLDCGANEVNKKLAMELGIKAFPTFHVYKEGKLIGTSVGAKMSKLKDIINQNIEA